MNLSKCPNCDQTWDASRKKCSSCSISEADVYMAGGAGASGFSAFRYHKFRSELRALDDTRQSRMRAANNSKLNPIYEARR